MGDRLEEHLSQADGLRGQAAAQIALLHHHASSGHHAPFGAPDGLPVLQVILTAFRGEGKDRLPERKARQAVQTSRPARDERAQAPLRHRE